MDDEPGGTGAWMLLLSRLFLSAPVICRFERSGKVGSPEGKRPSPLVAAGRYRRK
ncbi:hypothetical protein [Salinimonas iocasae]|uniref:hypothetical protein n=1 Tax=Salinimonas iocasae TaxID=2572577 RepID=UPI00143D8A54|nr:hypothetical protein [Salinimonas iocasae]